MEQLLIPLFAFLAGLGLASLVILVWNRPLRRRRESDAVSQTTLPLLEAMETIASAPVERQALADAVALSADRVFKFDGLQFGLFESSHFRRPQADKQGQEIEPDRSGRRN